MLLSPSSPSEEERLLSCSGALLLRPESLEFSSLEPSESESSESRSISCQDFI